MENSDKLESPAQDVHHAHQSNVQGKKDEMMKDNEDGLNTKSSTMTRSSEALLEKNVGIVQVDESLFLQFCI